MKKHLTGILLAICAAGCFYRASIYEGQFLVQDAMLSTHSDQRYKYKLRAIGDDKRKFWEPGRTAWLTSDSLYRTGDTIILTKKLKHGEEPARWHRNLDAAKLRLIGNYLDSAGQK